MDSRNNYFVDHIETAHIDATFKSGKIIDVKTGEEILLREGSKIKIIAPLHYLEEKTAKPHRLERRNKFLNKGDILKFRFHDQKVQHEFIVELLEDLYILQKGNKLNRLESCKCSVIAERTREHFEVDSLNQAFTKASVKYRPDNRTHTCNVFKTFLYKGEKLDDLRYTSS